jgi:ubiquinone/menaquinone biosynthesis C-methylase UbiE
MKMKVFDKHRADVLKTVRGKIVEIGFGTGANLKYYPSSIKEIAVVEPNSGMNKYLEDNLKKSLIRVNSIMGTAENLPFDDHTVDTVVSTLTLCSVADPARVLLEIKRVLRAGGRLMFFEHGLSPELNIQKWQNRLNPIQKTIADGCNLNRDIRSLLEQTGFDFESIENFYLKPGPKTHGYMYKGIAKA